MISSITFDELAVQAVVSRHRHGAVVRRTDGKPMGLLCRTAGRCSALIWHVNPSLSKPTPCPLEVFAIVATMI